MGHKYSVNAWIPTLERTSQLKCLNETEKIKARQILPEIVPSRFQSKKKKVGAKMSNLTKNIAWFKTLSLNVT